MKPLMSLSFLWLAAAGLATPAAHAATAASCSPQAVLEGPAQVGQPLTLESNCTDGGEAATYHWTFQMTPGSCGEVPAATGRRTGTLSSRRRAQALPTSDSGPSVTVTPDSAGHLVATVTQSAPEQADVVGSVDVCIADPNAEPPPVAGAPAHLDELSVPLVRLQTDSMQRQLSRAITHLDERRRTPNSADRDGMDWFVMGLDEVLRHGDNGNTGPFRLRSDGLSAGVDYRANDAWVIGGALGYTHSSVSFADSASAQRGNGVNLTAFASFSPSEQFYVSAALSHEQTRFALRRDTANAAGDIAEASVQGHGNGLALSAGTDQTFGAWTLSPYVRLEWVRVDLDAFDESGSADALSVSQQAARSASFNVGSSLQTSIPMSWGVLLPQARLEFTHLFGLRDGGAGARLFNGNATVALPTAGAVDRQFGNAALGLSAITQGGWTVFGEAEFGFAQDGYGSSKLSLGVRHEL